MSKIKNLSIKKLIKELDYIETDFEYRTEVVNDADSSFLENVNKFLESHPEIKEVYDKKINDRIDQMIKKPEDDVCEIKKLEDEVNDSEIPDNEEQKDIKQENRTEISSKVKRLYREIVKLTHPDRVNKKTLNDLYIKATEYYNIDDKVGIYKICSDLEIEWEIDDDDDKFISDKIDNLKKKIGFLESTFTWKWLNCKSDSEKDQIMVNFIKMRIQ